MLEVWPSTGITPFNRRSIIVCAVNTRGSPAAGSTPGSVPSAARPIGIGRAPILNAVRKLLGRAVSRRLTAPKQKSARRPPPKEAP
jgi:hypothetical protein